MCGNYISQGAGVSSFGDHSSCGLSQAISEFTGMRETLFGSGSRHKERTTYLSQRLWLSLLEISGIGKRASGYSVSSRSSPLTTYRNYCGQATRNFETTLSEKSFRASKT